MRLALPNSWEKPLQNLLASPEFIQLSDRVRQAYQGPACYPDFDSIFSAFSLCDFNKVKVVILGQDPYHGPGQAHGLSFSVKEGVSIPPSLNNIFKEVASNGYPCEAKTGDLTQWAKQGVFLLNSILTVEAHKPSSHKGLGWESFTDAVIAALSQNCQGLVFMLWGGYAQNKSRWIDESKHLILNSGHPSPLSANRGYWFGNNHFSRCNHYLVKTGAQPIDWSVYPPTRLT